MVIKTYTTASDPRKVDKALRLLNQFDNVVIKDLPDSLTDPVIVSSVNENWTNVNYIYIEEYHRYYNVVDVRKLFGGRIEIVCHVDVLMSNASRIKSLKAIVSRSTSSGNPYLVDGERSLLNYRTQRIINFPTNKQFNSELTYVLTVAGGA